MPDPTALAQELTAAYAARDIISTPSSREGGIDLSTAYAVEAEIARARRDAGHRTVGWKVGYANKAVWRALKLETLVWAHVYDDTVRYADWNDTRLSIASMVAPKIEPEGVLSWRRLRRRAIRQRSSRRRSGTRSDSRSSTACFRSGNFN